MMITLFGFELTAKLGPSIAIRERNQQMLAAEKAAMLRVRMCGVHIARKTDRSSCLLSQTASFFLPELDREEQALASNLAPPLMLDADMPLEDVSVPVFWRACMLNKCRSPQQQ